MPTTINIPGGTATLRDPEDIRVKHRRPIQVLALSMSPEARQVLDSAQPGSDISFGGLPEADITNLIRINEAAVYARLLSWTIPDPLPESAQDVEEMRGVVYDVLMAECVRSAADLATDGAGRVVDQFSVGAVEDQGSPIGASAGLIGSSVEVAVLDPSADLSPHISMSTGTEELSGV